MKRILLALSIVLALSLTSCSQAMRMTEQPPAKDLPASFVFVSNEGNGYFKYQAPEGFFLVSRQKQGDTIGAVFNANVFIDIIYMGK